MRHFVHSKNHTRSAELIVRARQMLHHPTPSEQCLWDGLMAANLPAAFKRQVVLGRFIVDLVAPSARLVVEVDGPHHASRRRADARRDLYLSRLGFRVLRIPAELVMADLQGAVERVREALEA